jgi:hypothetical protein
VSTLLYVVLIVLAWMACGHFPGKTAAALQFESSRRAYYSLARDDPSYGRGAATGVYICCLLAGPLSLLLGLANYVVGRSVPGLVEAAAAKKRRELDELQRQIDDAHRHLGLPPLRNGRWGAS